MMLALGTVIVARDTGAVLLGRRAASCSYAGNWSFFGGKPEPGDDDWGDALGRELAEELGPVPGIIETYALDDYASRNGKFRYASFVTAVAKQWHPSLNAEHDDHAWCEIGAWPEPLHPGAKAVLCSASNVAKIRAVLDSVRARHSSS